MKKEELLSKFKEFTAKRESLSKRKYKYVIDIPCMQLGHIKGMSMPAIKTAFCVIDEMTSISDKAINELDICTDLFTNDERLEYSTFEGFTREQWIDDLKTRVAEIQDARRLTNLDKALVLIEKWLSADDLLDLDLEKINNLLAGLE